MNKLGKCIFLLWDSRVVVGPTLATMLLVFIVFAMFGAFE